MIKIWPLDLWPWKSIGFQTLLRTMYVPSLVDSSVHKDVTRYKFDPVTLTFDLWPWKSIGFQTLLRTKYVPSLVKIHWRMLILECSQGCYAVKIWPSDLDLWPWKSIGFQTLLKTKYVPSLVKIHWRMLILVFTRMLHGKNLTWWPWPLTLKINRVPDSLKD